MTGNHHTGLLHTTIAITTSSIISSVPQQKCVPFNISSSIGRRPQHRQKQPNHNGHTSSHSDVDFNLRVCAVAALQLIRSCVPTDI